LATADDRAQRVLVRGHRAFLVAAHVTGPAAPGVRAPDHDISPPVQDQLVLELEIRVLGAERLDVLPGRGSCRLALPLHKNLVHPAGQAETHSAFGLRSNRAMMQGRQRRWIRRGCPLELLEQPHVKHVVDAGAGQQGKADSDFIDELGDAVRPKETRLELASDSLGKRSSRALSKAKERPVSHLVRDVAVRLVVVQLLRRLSLVQPVADVSQELRALLHALGDRSHRCVPRLIRSDGRRIVPVDDAERRVPQRRLVGGVEKELPPWELA
jgi:hypothetical protein